MESINSQQGSLFTNSFTLMKNILKLLRKHPQGLNQDLLSSEENKLVEETRLFIREAKILNNKEISDYKQTFVWQLNDYKESFSLNILRYIFILIDMRENSLQKSVIPAEESLYDDFINYLDYLIKMLDSVTSEEELKNYQKRLIYLFVVSLMMNNDYAIKCIKYYNGIFDDKETIASDEEFIEGLLFNLKVLLRMEFSKYHKVTYLFDIFKMSYNESVEDVKGKLKILSESFNNTVKDDFKIKESDFLHIKRKIKHVEFMLDNISNLNKHFIPMYKSFDSIEMMRYGASYSLSITPNYNPFNYNFFNDLVEDQDFWDLVKVILQSKVIKSYYEYEKEIRKEKESDYKIDTACADSLMKHFDTNDYYLMQHDKIFNYFRKSINFIPLPRQYFSVTDLTLNVYINSNYLKVFTNFAEDYSKLVKSVLLLTILKESNKYNTLLLKMGSAINITADSQPTMFQILFGCSEFEYITLSQANFILDKYKWSKKNYNYFKKEFEKVKKKCDPNLNSSYAYISGNNFHYHDYAVGPLQCGTHFECGGGRKEEEDEEDEEM